MKRIVVIINLLCLVLVTQAQYNYKTHKKQWLPEPAKVILVYAGSIALDAAGDALNDSNRKEWGHACNAASVGLLLVSPFIIDYNKSKWGYYLTSYVALRIALFDPIYNSTRGLPLTYIGNSSLWDKGLQKLAPPEGFMIGRGLSLILGVSIPITKLNNK